jgi:hypothetical protein
MPKVNWKGAAGAQARANEDYCREYKNPITGNVFMLKKPPAAQWYFAQQLPQDLMRRAKNEMPKNQALDEVMESIQSEVPNKERDDLTDYSLRLLEHGMVSPRFKRKLDEGDDPEDYYTLPGEQFGGKYHLLDEDWTYIMGIVAGTSDEEIIPLEDGGEMTRGELAAFPDQPWDGEYDQHGRRVSEVRTAPKRPARYQSFGSSSRG